METTVGEEVVWILDELIKRHLEKVLVLHNWNKTHAAKILGVSRWALCRMMKKYKIQKEVLG